MITIKSRVFRGFFVYCDPAELIRDNGMVSVEDFLEPQQWENNKPWILALHFYFHTEYSFQSQTAINLYSFSTHFSARRNVNRDMSNTNMLALKSKRHTTLFVSLSLMRLSSVWIFVLLVSQSVCVNAMHLNQRDHGYNWKVCEMRRWKGVDEKKFSSVPFSSSRRKVSFEHSAWKFLLS